MLEAYIDESGIGRKVTEVTLTAMTKLLLKQDSFQLFIDGKKTKKYTYQVKEALKGCGIRVSTLKLVSHQSKGGLRISDTIAGISRLFYDSPSKKDSKILFEQCTKKKITTQILSGLKPNPPHGR